MMHAGDIVQDQANGWFYRINNDGTADNLSETTSIYNPADQSNTLNTPKVSAASIRRPVVLIRDGSPTGDGDRMATRVAGVLAKRYA